MPILQLRRRSDGRISTIDIPRPNFEGLALSGFDVISQSPSAGEQQEQDVPNQNVSFPSLNLITNPLRQGPVLTGTPGVGTQIQTGIDIACGLFPSLCGNGVASPLGFQENGGPVFTNLFTGECPPGRVRRTRKPTLGRDICAKKPRMNPLNPRALVRATRRLASFNKFAKKTSRELAKLAPPRRRVATARGGRCVTCATSPCAC